MIIRKGTFGSFKFPEIEVAWSDTEMLLHRFTDDYASSYARVSMPAPSTYISITASVKPTYTAVVKPTASTFTPV